MLWVHRRKCAVRLSYRWRCLGVKFNHSTVKYLHHQFRACFPYPLNPIKVSNHDDQNWTDLSPLIPPITGEVLIAIRNTCVIKIVVYSSTNNFLYSTARNSQAVIVFTVSAFCTRICRLNFKISTYRNVQCCYVIYQCFLFIWSRHLLWLIH